VSQFPSSEMEPAILIVCPTTVVTTSLKVTATLVAAVQEDEVVVLVDRVDTLDVLDDTDVVEDDEVDPEPVMAISAQVR
jgi:hypothetical protein